MRCLRAPDFWRADGVAARLLAPAGALYGAIAARRLQRDAPHAALPTIIVGGLTAGGDGKTPLVIALARALSAQGETPALLSRGYGRLPAPSKPFNVDAERDLPEAVGDEALLLARHALAIVGADRVASAKLARERGASVIILDDGFQSRGLAADLSLLAVDSHYGAGNGRCLPAGPLRAPLRAQIAAADALIVIGDGAAGKALATRAPKPVFAAHVVPDARIVQKLEGARVVAFAGIGRPEKFFATLRAAGAQLVETRSFPDHHRFSAREIAGLAELGARSRARLVTTEKDALRLRGSGLDVDILPIRLAFSDADGLAATLALAIARARLRAS